MRQLHAGACDQGLARGITMTTDLGKSKRKAIRPTTEPELTWEIARLFPAQGDWSEEDYFELDNNHRVEYSDGFLEFLPMPTIFPFPLTR